jgi:GR25 family glycosyltransferase involved in LPS biosynthesis
MDEQLKLELSKLEDPDRLRERLLSEARELVAQGDPQAARQRLLGFEWAPVDDEVIAATDELLLPDLRRRSQIIGTSDASRRSRDGECVVIYGNYPHAFQNLFIGNEVRRHASMFWRTAHDRFEADPAWEGVQKIYLINMDARVDRLDAVLNELCRARAPLDRLARISAVTPPEDTLASYAAGPAGATSKVPMQEFKATVGCLLSHLEVMRRIGQADEDNVVVLEDDFAFTSDTLVHLKDLKEFTSRRYDYLVCLLATSKYGLVAPKDDLVSYSMQPVTNTGGYMVSKEGARRLLSLWTEAHAQLLATAERAFAADRAWSSLQDTGRFLVFRRKMGFQAASFSNIEGAIARYYD